MHIESKRNYYLVFAALMVLTVATVWVAYFDLGIFNNLVAMSIALLKATLVVLVFMNVRHSSPLTKLTVVGALLWLIILFGFTLSDYDTRGLMNVPGK